MSRREAGMLARDNRQSRTTGRGGGGTPRRTRTSQGLLGTPANVVAATPDPAANAGVGAPVPAPAPAARPPPGPPAPPMAPGLKQESIDYIVSTVLNQAADTTLTKVSAYEGISSYLDLSDLTEAEVPTLQYTEPAVDENGDETGDTTIHTIPRHTCKLITLFNAYCRYRCIIHDDPVTIHNCMHIEHDDFIDFRQSQYKHQFLGAPVVTPTSSKRSLAQEFTRTVKVDPSLYPVLREDKNWDTFNRSLQAVCRVHGLMNVLNKNYVPVFGSPEFELHDRHLGFLYNIFVTNLQTDKGKELVRKYQSSSNAQHIYSELANHCKESIIADSTAATKMTWLTSTKIEEGSWRGTTESFISYWREQLRLYHELVPHSSRMPDQVVRGLLENAVSLMPHLARVKNLCGTLKATTGTYPDLPAYIDLLVSAAQTYDRQHASSKPKSSRRKVYYTDTAPSDTVDYDPSSDDGFAIDQDLDTILAFQTQTRRPPPRLPMQQWQQLDDDSKRTWAQLSNAAKSVILGPSTNTPASRPPGPPPRPPPRSVNLHDISAADYLAHLHDSSMGSDGTVTTAQSDDTPSDAGSTDQILAHLTKQSPLPPGELKRVMSDKLAAQKATPHKTQANKNEITIDGVTYRACMHKIVYSVMSSSTSRKNRQLVDRGANGIVGGEDARVLFMTDRTVDVEGIDRHQMNNIRIGTLCGYVQTNRGPAIAILNQAANTGRGQTSLSSIQMEAFGVNVDDKSIKVGGKQCISTPDGFEIPLDIQSGLAYIKMRPPTDRELASDIPHVVLTSDKDWDPSVLDHSIDDVEQWALDRPTDGPEEVERPFDNLGILKVTKAVSSSNHDELDTFESILEYFETFDQYLPTDGLYEASTPDSDHHHADPDPLPPECLVYEARRRPPDLFVPEPSVAFDIESAPLVPPKPTKTTDSDNTRRTRSQSSRKDDNTRAKPRPPPPRTEHEDPPNLNDNTVYKNPSSAVKPRERDWKRLRRHFAWLPKLVVQKTFDCTTQLARIPMSVHLQRHFKSPFPALNVNRRDEPVATDTVYADTPDIEHGHKAAQFFVGTMSLVSDVYGVKTDAQFLQTLQDNVRKRGAMSKLVSDSAASEQSKAVQDYLRWLMIDDWQSEPRRQNQNPAERRYQDIKKLANRILDRTGAPNNMWLLALQYASFVYNHSAVKSLNWKTPISVLTGITPDISVLLRFAFYELVYFKNDEPSFPSESPESLGRIVGIAEHVSHALTYKILDLSTNRIISRSEV